MHRPRPLAILLTLASLSAAAHADSWIGHSLELNVSDAQLVLRAIVAGTQPIPDGQGLSDGYAHHTVTLQIKEILKSPPELAKAGTLTVILPDDDDRNIEAWQKNQTELLVCLVKTDRYRMKGDDRPLAAPWSIRHGRGGETAAIPLDGNPGRRAPTLDLVFLKTADDILKRAAAVIKADTLNPTPRSADGTIPSMEIDLPFDSPMDLELHSKSSNALTVPLTPLALAQARPWAKAADPWSRINAVRIVEHFKSDENIALLKSLLNDPDAQHQIAGTWTLTTYPVRAAAQDALKAWGIAADAVTEERKPLEK